MKLKSFGLVEAMIASFIAITVLSGAVALASSVNKSTTTESSYAKAEQIADNFLENLNFANSQGRIFFDDRSKLYDKSAGSYSIDCFDSRSASACEVEYWAAHPGLLAFYPDMMRFYWDHGRTEKDLADLPFYKVKTREIGDDSYGDNFFKVKTTINILASCKTVTGLAIPTDKCRVVDVELKWSENVGDQTYKVSRYITDWTR